MRIEVFLFNSEKYIIMIGRNKKDNFEIIDNSVDTDIWFHIYEEPSCHVILKNTDKMREIPKQVMKRCAYLCKINSKSKYMKKCDVIYTPISNVIKTEIEGQVAVSSYKKIAV